MFDSFPFIKLRLLSSSWWQSFGPQLTVLTVYHAPYEELKYSAVENLIFCNSFSIFIFVLLGCFFFSCSDDSLIALSHNFRIIGFDWLIDLTAIIEEEEEFKTWLNAYETSNYILKYKNKNNSLQHWWRLDTS